MGELLGRGDFWHGERRVSERFQPGRLAGYPHDLRGKTATTRGPTHPLGVPLVVGGPGIGAWLHPVTVCQVALGWHERWLHDGAASSRAQFLALADWLIEHQRPWAGGGAWPIGVTLLSYGRLEAPWVSALVQGQALSVLARVAALSPARAARAREAMDAAFVLFELDRAHGGVCAEDEHGVAFEEYPSVRPSLVLNGLISALWGLADLALVQGDGPARRAFDAGTAALLDRLHRYDLGFWSRYCLYPYPVPEVASAYYHRTHIAQLEAMERLVPDERWARWRMRFAAYRRRRLACGAALAAKVVARLVRLRTATGRWHVRSRHEWAPARRRDEA